MDQKGAPVSSAPLHPPIHSTMSTNAAPDTPEESAFRRILRVHVSDLEYTYKDQPDKDNKVQHDAWQKAIAKKTNRIAKVLGTAPGAPPALPPLTLCALFLHNIRATTGQFDFAQLQPVTSEHAALSPGGAGLGIPLDADGTLFPLLPRDQLDVNMGGTTGTSRQTYIICAGSNHPQRLRAPTFLRPPLLSPMDLAHSPLPESVSCPPNPLHLWNRPPTQPHARLIVRAPPSLLTHW